jgi:uncharacterized protein YggE
VVATATAKGATEVNGLSFEVADPASAMDEARAATIAQARTSAQKMTAAAGVSLGEVVSISESFASTPGPYYSADSLRGATIPQIEPGTQDVQATVSVIFFIE